MKTKEGLWRLSPSGLYGFSECPACFWVDNHFRKPPMLPLLLNTAMDEILKNRYDSYRKEGAFPPEAEQLREDGVLVFEDLDKLNDWRENMSSLRVVNEKRGYVLQGKIDDVLLEKDGRLVPADYKSSGNPPKEDKQKYYRDQLAGYGFMFESNGFMVSDRAYLLHYFPKNKSAPEIKIEFDGHVDRVDIGSIDIEKRLSDIVDLLEGPFPGYNSDCDKCSYYAGREELLRSN
ncbi:MAG: PD-(D/E)XK nuclease family protein [Patescibacteria group bacterium]